MAAGEWLEELLRGRLVTTLAILAVAFVGYQMISGRMSLKAALRVALGCFILFGSSAIAQGLIGVARDGGVPAPPTPAAELVVPVPSPRTPPVSANPFDPYSGNPRPN